MENEISVEAIQEENFPEMEVELVISCYCDKEKGLVCKLKQIRPAIKAEITD